MTTQYTDFFKRIHQRLGSNIPIHRFAELANPQGLGLGSKQDFYAPVRFSVQVCGSITHPSGTIRMDIPVHANKAWYADLKQKLAGTLGLGSRCFIELRTVTGKPLNEVDPDRLSHVGNLQVFVDGKQKRFAEMPKVPIEYSVTKRQELRKWQLEAVRDLPLKIADELHRKNAIEVDAAIRVDGSVQKIIETHLRKSVPKWSEFVRVHHTNSPKIASESDADVMLRTISTDMLGHIRSFIAASKERINKHISAVESKQLAASMGKNAKHVAPILGAPLPGASSSLENGHELYSTLVEHAFKSPTLERSVLETLFMAPMASSVVKRHAELVPVRKIATHHPWYGQIHSLLPLRGTYPSNYIAGHTKRDMSVNAPYPKGDMAKTYKAYHLFSGQHIAPPSMVISCGPIKKKKSKSKNREVESHGYDEMENEKKKYHNNKKKGGARRKHKGRDVGEDHPGLISLERLYIANDSDSESYGSGGGENSLSDSDIDAHIVPIKEKPKTSRLAAVGDEEEDEYAAMGLPPVDDLFK